MSELGLKMPDDLLTAEAWDTLAMVYDPELGINLVDLGLVYKLAVMNGEASVAMTLTTPRCVERLVQPNWRWTRNTANGSCASITLRRSAYPVSSAKPTLGP